MQVVADRCSDETLNMIKSTGLPVVNTDLGNAGSLRFALELALEGSDEDLVYFCEDDYLHLDKAPKLLEEGIRRAEYVTLYDHPDKYTSLYDGGEVSKVIKTASSHWRYTVSTCMTFGCRVRTLREDMEIWREFTAGPHPHDHFIFSKLREKRRRLAVCIPGAACHTDLTVSGHLGWVAMDSWAIEMMIEQTQQEIARLLNSPTKDNLHDRMVVYSLEKDRQGWERLVALDAFLSGLKK